MTPSGVRFVPAASTTFACRESGAGPLAILLHGFGSDGRLWDGVRSQVAPGRRCVAVDMRGAGMTPLGGTADVSLDRHADDVAELIGALGDRAADVVGFSMGGFVLLALLERHPGVVRSATFVGTRANADDEQSRAGRDAMARTLLDGGRGAAFLEMLPKLVAPDATDLVRARLRTMFEEQPYEGLVAALRAMRDRPDRLAAVAAARAPVLVVAGDGDAFAPLPLTSAVADAAAHGRMEILAGAGHTMPLERPDDVARLLSGAWSGGESAG